MPETAAHPRLSRGHKKRERTRRQLVEAGLAVLAEKGEALTVSDVAARAEVSNGTFYNYFTDRHDLFDALAAHTLLSLAARAASETPSQDPARRFVFATRCVLEFAEEDPVWGRAILRLVERRRGSPRETLSFLRDDLAAGLASGRFAYGPDAVTLDAVVGLISMTIRRITLGEARPGHVPQVLERGLRMLGVSADEAAAVVEEAGAAAGVA